MARRPAKSVEASEAVSTGPQPRTTLNLIGHAEAEQSLLQAWNQNRFHHAWFIAGQRGIGKATLAYKLARFLLSNPEMAGEGLFGATGPTDLNTPENNLVSIGAHPDLAVIERKLNDKGKLSAVIRIDDVRSLSEMMGLTRNDSWRVVIIDGAEDMNKNASNAVLKVLEEPPTKVCFILVSHAPAKVLPTIRSRCRRLDLKPLANSHVEAILEQHDLYATDAVLALSSGSPGRALRLADAGVDDVLGDIDRALAGDLTALEAITVAEGLSGRDAQARYELYLELFPDRMGALLKTRRGDLEPAFALWDKARTFCRQAMPLSYDSLLVIHELNGIARTFSKMI
jgi:DNA polymerase III subunit delta'